MASGSALLQSEGLSDKDMYKARMVIHPFRFNAMPVPPRPLRFELQAKRPTF
jgi:hypothetical protein